MKSSKEIRKCLIEDIKKEKMIDEDCYDYPYDDENMYKIIKYERGIDSYFYIRKYGERDGFWISTNGYNDVEEMLIELSIENRNLKKKIKDAKRALR